MSVTLLIVDLLQFFVCCIRSGLTRCTRLMVPYLDRMCRLGNTPCPGRSSVYYAPPRCRPSQYLRTFVPLTVSLWNDLADGVGSFPPVRRCGTGRFQEQGQCFFVNISCSIPTIVFYYFSLSFLPVCRLVLSGYGLCTDRVYLTLSQPCKAKNNNRLVGCFIATTGQHSNAPSLGSLHHNNDGLIRRRFLFENLR